MGQMKQDLDENGVLTFEKEVKAWVNLYASVYQKRDVTYYMHVMVKHAAAVLTNHGSLNRFSQQTFEKLNDQITKCYFRGLNHQISNLQALLNRSCKRQIGLFTCTHLAIERQTKYTAQSVDMKGIISHLALCK